MADAATTQPAAGEFVDVLIIGAGLSGIGAACHLRRNCPGKTFVIVEARPTLGGTWDLFRYPGIRSDSDMYTLGYSFRPWREAKAIAAGDDILRYITETAREYDVSRLIRFHHRAERAEWSSAEAHWSVQIVRTDTGARRLVRCRFLYVCAGYYRYDQGYVPDFPGIDDFRGRIVHPQHWPEDLDYTGKRVVVIGSGATAVTLVPAMAPVAAHVTMLQRSPSYVLAIPARDRIAEVARRALPARFAHSVVKWKNVALLTANYQLSRRRPQLMKSLIRRGLAKGLPPGYDIDTHFRPRYDPWDQRLCFAPDADLFRALRSGRARVVTDSIETFTRHGIRLVSGSELAADIVVTATGLNLLGFGGLSFSVDGQPVSLADTIAYKGMMLAGVPNFAFALGYTNASWTLKCDLVSEYVCRLLTYMDERGYRRCTPRPPDAAEPTHRFVDLTSGYIQRSIADLPKQGNRPPWRLHQNYARDLVMLRRGPLTEEMEFDAPLAPAPAVSASAAGGPSTSRSSE